MTALCFPPSGMVVDDDATTVVLENAVAAEPAADVVAQRVLETLRQRTMPLGTMQRDSDGTLLLQSWLLRVDMCLVSYGRRTLMMPAGV